ncbi:MAG: nicotinamide mononucleotide transporter [Alistipes sp.]|nr:nicotinamide mononucleotide transporter [Alistipes sp.]
MDWKLTLQIIGVALGLLYLYFEYKANIWLWVIGLIMPIVHGTLYFRQGLYADFSMELYYILAGIYGLVAWRRGDKKSNSELKIAYTPCVAWVAIVGVYVLLHATIYMLLVTFTDSNVPFWDSLTTSLSVVAYWLLSRKYVEQWLVWLAVDVITVGLYIYKDIPLTAGLYALYSALAIAGYMRWRRVIESEKA